MFMDMKKHVLLKAMILDTQLCLLEMGLIMCIRTKDIFLSISKLLQWWMEMVSLIFRDGKKGNQGLERKLTVMQQRSGLLIWAECLVPNVDGKSFIQFSVLLGDLELLGHKQHYGLFKL